MSKGADILDGFFVQPGVARAQPGVVGGVSPWTEEQQQRTASQAIQPHTPDNSIDVGTVVSDSSSSCSHRAEKGHLVGRDRGGSEFRSYSAETPADNVCLGHDVSEEGANSSKSQGMGQADAPLQGVSTSMSGPAYAQMPSSYNRNLRQPMASSQIQRHSPFPYVQTTVFPGAEQINETDMAALAARQAGDAAFERLIAILDEGKRLATALLAPLPQTLASPSPATAVMNQVISSIDESLSKLEQLCGTCFCTIPACGTATHNNQDADISEDGPQAARSQTQHQHVHCHRDASEAPFFPDSSMGVSCDSKGFWCSTQPSRGCDMKGDSGGRDGSSIITTTVTPQQHGFESAVVPSDQMLPYPNNGTTVTMPHYHTLKNAPILGVGDGLSSLYNSTVEPACLRIDNGSDSNYENTMAFPFGEEIRGPPRRAEEIQTPENELTESFLAFVEFKRGRVRKYDCRIDIAPGQYVLVDGDRGRDCGLVVQTIKNNPDGSSALCCMDGCNVNADKIKLEKGRVLCVATAEEIGYMHHTMQRAERVALETCRKMCQDMGININLQDCEYQFDMEKVSFYFNSEHSVDFRPLVRELYRTFRVRIWMENTNPHVKNSMPIGGNGMGRTDSAADDEVPRGTTKRRNGQRRSQKSAVTRHDKE